MTALPTTTLPDSALMLARTESATRTHLVECPHLVGRVWHAADEEEAMRFALCDWSEREISGLGRSHPATLSDAMREHGTPAGVVARIRDLLKFVTHDEIWLPYSRSYVALGLEGRAVASFGKSYVWVGDRRIDLPGYVAGRHQGHRAVPTYDETCPVTFEAHPLSGECDRCN